MERSGGKLNFLDRIGGVHRPTWRAAFCGLMPISLAVLEVHFFTMSLVVLKADMPLKSLHLAGYEPQLSNAAKPPCANATIYKIILCVVPMCNIIAAVGAFSQRVNTALARTTFYIHAVGFAIACFIVTLYAVTFIPIVVIIMVIKKDLFATAYISLVMLITWVVIAIILGLMYWCLQIHKSLYQILAAGGTGWEFMTAEEISLNRRAQSIEEGRGVSTPLLSGNPDAYI